MIGHGADAVRQVIDQAMAGRVNFVLQAEQLGTGHAVRQVEPLLRGKCARVLVTFNGKAFDMNMIRERAIFHGLKMPPEGPHLDLLTEARKRWRGRLPNCKLQTLERHLFKRNRVGDIPGWAIADAYHKFVDTADARQVRDIVHHNLLDLLTMAQLVSVILTGEDPMDA